MSNTERPIDTSAFTFVVTKPTPKGMPSAEWDKVYTLMHRAFSNSLPAHRTTTDVDKVLGDTDVATFALARRFPKTAPNYEKQSFAHKRVVLAYAANNILAGYMYTADNTSGDMIARNLKMAIPPQYNPTVAGRQLGGRRYAWVRELAVDPVYQHTGLAHVMGYVGLHDRPEQQPVSAYIWPTELPQMAESLQAIGMHYAGEGEAHDKRVDLYGYGVAPVRQEHWLGKVATIRENILAMPGASDAISQALVDIQSQ